MSDNDRGLRMLTIYDRPLDMPGCVVVRGWRVRGGEAYPEPGAVAFMVEGDDNRAALAAARRHCRSLQLTSIGRHDDHDPKIVEVWI